jgi:uncharacterized protein (TIGR03067 family)
MTNRLALVVAVVVLWTGTVLSADTVLAAGRGAPNDEAARFEGVWRFATVAVNGTEHPAPPFETNKLIIYKGGRYVIVQGPRITRGVIHLDPTASPKHYDVTITSGPAKGVTSPGVYEFDGDTYRACLPLGGKDRPAAVASRPGTIFFAFRREKQDVRAALEAVGRQELAGRWQSVSYALDGKKAADADMKRIQLVIDGEGNSSAYNDGKLFIASTIKIDPTQEPLAMDLTFTAGAPKGTVSLGIYKIDGDVLTICRAPAKKSRPTEFASTPGSGLTLMSYKRERAK